MITRDRAFYRDFIRIFLVLAFQNVIMLSVNLADNIMLGGYSEVALTAVATVNQIQFLLQQVMLGIGDGMVVLASQYWGKKDMQAIDKIVSIAIRVALLVIVLLFIGVSVNPARVIQIFTRNSLVVAEGVKYLSIIRFTYLFFGITFILLAAMRTVETVKIAFFLSLNTLAVNCTLNYILIYGKLSFPRLGATGAAIGTLIARIIECAIAIIYITCKEKNIKFYLKDYLTIDYKLVKDYFNISTPIIIVCIMWGVSTGMQTVILGHLSAGAIAANSIAATLLMILRSGIAGAASTASVLTGKTIGLGKLDKVQEYARTMQIIFVAIGIVTSLLLFTIRIPVLSFYKISPETSKMANAFILVLCVACIGSAYENPTITGIIRGGGSTRFDMLTDLISIWCIVLPISAAAAFIFKWPPVAVIACLNADQIFKCIPAYFKVNYGHWIREFTK